MKTDIYDMKTDMDHQEGPKKAEEEPSTVSAKLHLPK